LRKTNHIVRWEENRPWHDVLDEKEGAYIGGADTYAVFECAGCGKVRLLHSHWFSEDMDGEGDPIIRQDYYPPTVTRQKPSWRRNVFPWVENVEELNPLFDEVYSAHAAGAFTLATMGIRALTEKIMVEQVGDKGTFAKTVEAFFQAGFVAPIQQSLFSSVLIEAGHAAMHRSFRPSPEDVETLLDLVEGLVDQIYYQPLRAGAVGKRLPPDTRQRKR
jgi:hypothetical protein